MKRINKVDKSKYWLLDKKIDQEALISEPQNKVSVAKTQVNVAKTQVNTSKKPQKESKLNESKLNERRAAAKSKQQSKQSDTSYDINSFKDYDIFD